MEGKLTRAEKILIMGGAATMFGVLSFMKGQNLRLSVNLIEKTKEYDRLVAALLSAKGAILVEKIGETHFNLIPFIKETLT